VVSFTTEEIDWAASSEVDVGPYRVERNLAECNRIVNHRAVFPFADPNSGRLCAGDIEPILPFRSMGDPPQR